jgi:uncharacterized protein (TIGR03118 family)
MKKLTVGLLLGLLALFGGAQVLFAQQAAYQQTNLVANASGIAKNTDSQLSNPWGISFIPGQPFWLANNNGGTSTLYDSAGTKQSLVVTIPGASVNPCNPGCPTGTVANTSTDFGGAQFLFDSEDGVITGWSGANATTAVIELDNSGSGAVYKGLALITNSSGNFLLAANFNSGKVEVYDRNFAVASLAGSFTDPNLPSGMAPHGIHVVNGQVYVAYAMQDSAKHDPTLGAGSGVVDIFDFNGNFVKTFVSGGALNAPWGVVAASASFGAFSNDILIGNFGDGTMNAYDSTGKSLGQVTDTNGKAIVNPGLWDMVFGVTGTGDPNTLYFTAGGSTQTTGLFATMTPASSATSADFSLSLSSSTAMVASGQSTSVMVSAAPVGGFSSAIALSCSAGAGITCSFSPNMITPGSSTATSTLSMSAATSAPSGGYGYVVHGTGLAFSGLGAFGLGLAGLVLGGNTRKRKPTSRAGKCAMWIGGAVLLSALLMFNVACGGSSSSNSTPKTSPSTVTVMVTGTSGSLSHTVPLTLTVN